jgi:hypothetical protein
VRECEEVRVFEGRAERTGVTAVFRTTKNYPACSSVRDLIRKYRIHGDGVFYLDSAHWPVGQTIIVMDSTDVSLSEAFELSNLAKKHRRQNARPRPVNA